MTYGNGTISLGYVDPGDVDAKNARQMMDHFYQTSYTANAAFWVQGQIDKRFKVGDQALWSMIYGDSAYYQSRKFFFNLIRRHINMICGYQRKNRKSTITVPNYLDDSGDQLCDDYNQVLKWCDSRDGFQEYLSQSFEGACDVGQYLLHMYLDYTHDPVSGDLFTDSVAYNNFLIDPYYRKQDLSDCNFIWRRRWVSKEVAKSLLPDRQKEIDKLKPSGVKDGRFPLQAELINIHQANLLTYDEVHYLSEREATFIHDPMSGEMIEWEENAGDENDLMERTLAMQPWLNVVKRRIPTVKMAINIGDQCMYVGKNHLSIDRYPFVPALCYHEPDVQSYAWRFQGIVRNLRDAQFLYNRRKVIELKILESQVNSGWIFPVDVVTDQKAFRQTGEGMLIPIKAGHSAQEIERIQAPAIPESMIALSRSLAEDITAISGVNEELLGSATDDKSGILSMLRQGAGLTTLQTIFDKLDYSQRLYGTIRLQAIRKNFTPVKVRNILGRDAAPNFFTASNLKYNLTVEEGNYSASQRQTELQQLLHFKELGIPIANKTIINAAIITNKKKVIEDMQEEQEQQAQAQQAQAQAEEKQQNAKIMVDYAKSRSELAKEKDLLASAMERNAKVIEINESAEHKKMQSDLDLVKIMIGLEDMDLENFRKSLELAEIIKQQNQPQQLEEVGYGI